MPAFINGDPTRIVHGYTAYNAYRVQNPRKQMTILIDGQEIKCRNLIIATRDDGTTEYTIKEGRSWRMVHPDPSPSNSFDPVPVLGILVTGMFVPFGN